jgi:indole-3-acetate monooxygenase
MSTLTDTPLRSRVEELAPLIQKHADEAERDRRLSRTVFDAMVDAGLFRMFVPRELGGLELNIVEGFEIIERVAQIDSAAGWNLQIGAAAGPTTAALLPDAGTREIFSDPKAVVAGGFNPPGAAIPVDGGYRLSGRWGFASGCQHASWFADPALRIKDGQPEVNEHGQPVMLVLMYPAREANIIETWDPLG